MITVDHVQGTPEWHAHRAQHLNASDAPAMLGASTNHSRNDLIRELAAGVPREFSDFVQERVIDPGHEFEAQARVIAEALVGQDLYPVTGVAGTYSASFDGLTLLEDIAWEHKRLNQTLRDAMFDGCTGTDLPLMYQIQMEHQAMVSECERVFFMASEWRQASGGWELVEERHCWYTPNLELRARIVAGWAQLEADVAAFEPGPASEPVPVGRAPETLPALSIQVTGMVTASNLAEFKENALAVLGSINRELQSDEDFADAEKTVTWCKGVEERIEATKQQVLGQTADIDAVFRTMDDVAAETRKIRLELDKLVTKRKEERRTEIGNTARRAVIDHIQGFNETLGAHAVPMPATLVADLQAAIKGKRSFSSMQDAVDAVATNAKITASQAADRIRANIAILAEQPNYATLFADRVQLCSHEVCGGPAQPDGGTHLPASAGGAGAPGRRARADSQGGGGPRAEEGSRRRGRRCGGAGRPGGSAGGGRAGARDGGIRARSQRSNGSGQRTGTGRRTARRGQDQAGRHQRAHRPAVDQRRWAGHAGVQADQRYRRGQAVRPGAVPGHVPGHDRRPAGRGQ